jgi:hypothetical protein
LDLLGRLVALGWYGSDHGSLAALFGADPSLVVGLLYEHFDCGV